MMCPVVIGPVRVAAVWNVTAAVPAVGATASVNEKTVSAASAAIAVWALDTNEARHRIDDMDFPLAGPLAVAPVTLLMSS